MFSFTIAGDRTLVLRHFIDENCTMHRYDYFSVKLDTFNSLVKLILIILTRYTNVAKGC